MIIASAIQLTDGRVFVGKRHADCFKSVIDIHLKTGMDFEPVRRLHFNCKQGFINDKLEFLDREQAYYEAYASKQCKIQKPSEIENPCLYSEDLW